MSHREPAGRIDEEAARWVLRFDREGGTEASGAELERWLQADSRNRGALLRAEAAWASLDNLGSHASQPTAAVRHGRRSWTRGRFSRRAVLGALGACAAGVAVVAVLPDGGESYRTEVGEVRRFALADRSTAAINTASGIDVLYDDERRRIKLREGEVWFQVAKNRARPFVVEAGQVRVEAVGTAFSVRRRDGGAEVLVTEGVVRAWVVGAEGSATRVEAGSRAFVADDAAVTKAVAQPSELDRKLAWRAGKIDLAGETLATAVSEFNRHNLRKISVADPEAAAKRLYGVFRSDDPEGFARAAAISLDVRASAAPGGNIVIASTSR